MTAAHIVIEQPWLDDWKVKLDSKRNIYSLISDKCGIILVSEKLKEPLTEEKSYMEETTEAPTENSTEGNATYEKLT